MAAPIVLFGAFDRHNLGDLLFPHVAAALLGDEPVQFAGITARDLRGVGGHDVRCIAELAARRDDRPVRLLHVGGETLTCGAWPAAVMLLPPGEVQSTVAYLESRPARRAAWLREVLGRQTLAPYVLSRADWPSLQRVVHAGVGGVELDRVDAAMRAEVLGKLRDADALGVRDRRTQALLAREGIAAVLLPDPAVMVAELFGARIRRQGEAGEPAAMRTAFPQGYLAVQFSAAFGDDTTLATIAAQLARAIAATGLGVVLFRAGAAPWHDDLDGLERVAQRLPAAAVRVFRSLDVWDLCALLAGCAACVSSSLHGRIVATAFARPRLSLQPTDAGGRIVKSEAFAQTWDEVARPAAVPAELSDGLDAALAVDTSALDRIAQRLVVAYRDGFAQLRTALD